MGAICVHRLSAKDQALIRDTMDRFNRSMDTGDKSEFLSVFSKDGIRESPSGWGTIQGHDELGKAFDIYFSSPKYASFRGGQHRVTSLIYEKVEPGHVETWSTYIFVIPSPDGPKIAAMGTYRDAFVKEDNRWLFARRVNEITQNIIPGQLPSV